MVPLTGRLEGGFFDGELIMNNSIRNVAIISPFGYAWADTSLVFLCLHLAVVTIPGCNCYGGQIE